MSKITSTTDLVQAVLVNPQASFSVPTWKVPFFRALFENTDTVFSIRLGFPHTTVTVYNINTPEEFQAYNALLCGIDIVTRDISVASILGTADDIIAFMSSWPLSYKITHSRNKFTFHVRGPREVVEGLQTVCENSVQFAPFFPPVAYNETEWTADSDLYRKGHGNRTETEK